MTMRMTGMYSGLDTENVIEELVKAKSVKVDKIKKAKTKFEWKSEAWTSLNSKIRNFYNSSVSALRFSSAFKKKNTTTTNSKAVSVITGEGAMNGVQKLSINKLAKTGYMTGAKVQTADGTKAEAKTLLSDLRLSKGADGSETSGIHAIDEAGSFTVTVGDKVTKINIKPDSSIEQIVSQMKSAGIDANFDANNQRVYVASTTSGAEKDFAITADNAVGFSTLSLLGINGSLGTSVDPSENANAKTLAAYKDLASIYSSINSLMQYKTVDVMEEYDTGEVDEDGKAIMGTRVKTEEYDTGEVDGEGNPIMGTRNVTETVVDLDAMLARDELSVGSDLYNRLKAEVGDAKEGEENFEAAIEHLHERAKMANDIVNGGAYTASMYTTGVSRIAGRDAEITLNGVDYTSNSNNFEINGITLTCYEEAEDITVTTQEDTDGVYDMIKNFFKEYNSLINEMDKLYNAKSAGKYEPLTDDEKDEMSEKEIEKWEQKIKDASLRRDETLGTIGSSLKSIMMEGIEIKGEKVYLSNFGIETLNYFLAGENEKNAYHIAGDKDDAAVSSEGDKLKTAIANDPDTVVEFFVQLSRNLYKKMGELSSSSDYSSSGSFYDDKKFKTDMTDYESRIKEAEDKLAKYEDKYYRKFSAMEVALSKLQNSTNSLTSMLGGS